MADYPLLFTIPEQHKIKARDGLAGSFGYNPNEPDRGTKEEFIHRSYVEDMKRRVSRWEREQALLAIVDSPIEVT